MASLDPPEVVESRNILPLSYGVHIYCKQINAYEALRGLVITNQTANRKDQGSNLLIGEKELVPQIMDTRK